jgi:hypothetical protein
MRQPPDSGGCARPAAARGGPRSNQVGTLRAAAWYDASQTRVLKAPRSLRYTALDRSDSPPPQQRGTPRASERSYFIFSTHKPLDLIGPHNTALPLLGPSVSVVALQLLWAPGRGTDLLSFCSRLSF